MEKAPPGMLTGSPQDPSEPSPSVCVELVPLVSVSVPWLP